MIPDFSGNGTFADEAQLIVAFSTLAGVIYGGAKISKRVRRIDHAVNNVDVPITDTEVATLGQRIVRLEDTNDEQYKTLRIVAESLNEHVRASNRRHDRIEKKLDEVLGRIDDVRKVGD